MKNGALVGVVLIVLGVFFLAYQGITYTTHEKVLDIGPIEATQTKEKTIPFSPILGFAAIAGGIAVLVMSKRSTV